MTRFLDANIFIYAYYKPKKPLAQKERQMKEQAKQIITSINQGKEQIATTVVHLSEVVNILKHGMTTEQLNNLILGLFVQNNITIYGITREQYLAATELADELRLEPNDALAVDIMKQNGINEIYTYDEDFNNAHEITRLPKIQPDQ
jgi:predicted nucleic acid-binding protein